MRRERERPGGDPAQCERGFEMFQTINRTGDPAREHSVAGLGTAPVFWYENSRYGFLPAEINFVDLP